MKEYLHEVDDKAIVEVLATQVSVSTVGPLVENALFDSVHRHITVATTLQLYKGIQSITQGSRNIDCDGAEKDKII